MNADKKKLVQKRVDLQYDPTKLLQNETRASILMFISMYGKLNVSRLSTLLGKAKSTTSHHIKKNSSSKYS
ncbi:MAG: ArsR family transcriptional regulator [Candidatus Hodarchaeales archaeon]|jgi:DNA-binding transcriptional ArsR family regulator